MEAFPSGDVELDGWGVFEECDDFDIAPAIEVAILANEYIVTSAAASP